MTDFKLSSFLGYMFVKTSQKVPWSKRLGCNCNDGCQEANKVLFLRWIWGIPLHAGGKASSEGSTLTMKIQDRGHQKSKARVSVAPQKGLTSSKNVLKNIDREKACKWFSDSQFHFGHMHKIQGIYAKYFFWYLLFLVLLSHRLYTFRTFFCRME